MESGLDMLGEYGRPLLDRYGRTAIMVGVAVVAAVGVALLVGRTRRRRSFTDRITDGIPEMGARLQRPVSTIRSVAGRFSR